MSIGLWTGIAVVVLWALWSLVRRRQQGARRPWLAFGLRLLLVAALLAVHELKPVSAYVHQSDTATVTSFHAGMRLSADGTLRLRERLDVRMPPGKHGIFRIFDVRDERRRGLEHPVSDVAVTRDGLPEPFTWVDEGDASRTAKIGRADRTLDAGVHRYVITSQTTGALTRGPGDGEAQWHWNVIGDGWQMAMERTSATAILPARPATVECVMGDDTPCRAVVSGRTLTLATGALEPFTPVTVRVTFPAGAVPLPPAEATWIEHWGPTLLAGLLAALLAAGLVVATRERRPGFPVVFEPPAGISPALGAKVLSEIDARDDLQATLYDLGERGVLRLSGDDARWRVTVVGDPSAATPAEREMLSELGLRTVDAELVVSATEDAGGLIVAARKALRRQVRADARQYLRRSPAGLWGTALGWMAAAATLAMVAAYFFTPTGWRQWPLLVGCAVLAAGLADVMTDPAARSTRSAEGRELWSRLGGFARFLTTSSSEDRFEAAKHLDWYPRYLPWALAFGVADRWAQRYRDQAVEPPEPSWIVWSGTSGEGSMQSLSDSFSSAVSSASDAYAAAQSSSSDGGGGGGDGGGGGGGGSW